VDDVRQPGHAERPTTDIRYFADDFRTEHLRKFLWVDGHGSISLWRKFDLVHSFIKHASNGALVRLAPEFYQEFPQGWRVFAKGGFVGETLNQDGFIPDESPAHGIIRQIPQPRGKAVAPVNFWPSSWRAFRTHHFCSFFPKGFPSRSALGTNKTRRFASLVVA
jgi:hypothetical protein